MIEIKPVISGWKVVDVETAIKFVSTVRKSITNIREEEKDKYINENRLRGVTVEELYRKAGMRESAE